MNYADDTNILTTAKKFHELEINPTNDLIIVFTWMQQNRLVINTNKKKYIFFSVSKNRENKKITINNFEENTQDNTKF